MNNEFQCIFKPNHLQLAEDPFEYEQIDVNENELNSIINDASSEDESSPVSQLEISIKNQIE